MLTIAFACAGSPVTQDNALGPWLPVGGSALIDTAPDAPVGPAKCLALVKGVSDEWCKKNCWGVPRFCPSTQCDCSEAADSTVTVDTTDQTDTTPEALTTAEPTIAKQPDPSLLPSPSPQPAAQSGVVTKAARQSRGHYAAEKADDESEETGSRHSHRAKHHKPVAHTTKKLHAKSAMHKSEPRVGRSKAKTALLCASSPCLSFCPLNPACESIGRLDEAAILANQTDEMEEADESGEEPLTRKGSAHHGGSRLSQHRRGAAAGGKAERRGHHARKEEQERDDLTDEMAGRRGQRRASTEEEERQKLDDLTTELCAEDPCQSGCEPNAACALVVNSGIDGAYDGQEVATTSQQEAVAEQAL